MKMFFKFVIVAGLMISATDLSAAVRVPADAYDPNDFVMDPNTPYGLAWAPGTRYAGHPVRSDRVLAWLEQYENSQRAHPAPAPVPAVVPPIAPVPVVVPPVPPAPAPQPAPPAPAQPAVAKVCAKEFAKWLASLTIVSGMTYVAWSLLHDAARLCKNQQDVACPELGSGVNTVTWLLFAGSVYALYKTGRCLGKKRVDAAARGYNNVMQQNNQRARWTNLCCCLCDSYAAINEVLD